jgi:hypothetical protein
LNDLAGRLDVLVDYMSSAGESRWRDVLVSSAARMRAGELSGLRSFLGAFGTSGSFNEVDLVRGSWAKGKFVWEPGWEARSRDFERLKEEAYVLARQLDFETTPSFTQAISSGLMRSPLRTKLLLGGLGLAVLLLATYAIERGAA